MAGYNWLETKEKYVKQHDAITASVLLCNHCASFLSSIMIKHVYTNMCTYDKYFIFNC